MRKTALFLLGALLFAACSQTPTEGPINENDVIGGQVSVEFLTQAEVWNTEDVVNKNKDYYTQFVPEYMKSMYPNSEDYLSYLYTKDDSGRTPISFWKVGTIKNGDYAGQSLVVVQARCDGPCPAATFRYAVNEGTNEWTGLVPYSTSALGSGDLQGPGTDLEASITITALDTPASLNLYANDPIALADPFSAMNPSYYGQDDENFKAAYTQLTNIQDTAYSKYYVLNGRGCIFGETPDGILVRYGVMPSAFGFTPASEAKGDYSYDIPNQSQDFTLQISDGEKMIQEEHTYVLTAGGCGFAGSCVVTVTPTEEELASISELGTLTREDAGSNVGQTAYTISGVTEPVGDNPVYAEGLTGAVQQAYQMYGMALPYRDPPETPISMEEFLAQHEVIFLKLDNGSYVLAYDSAYAPSVECGKPVIYLYPTQAQQVSVKVNNITFSKTVPAYGNGWTVWANPNGSLKNLADGKTYPYLFWEGQSSAQVSMGTGWTLAKKDIAVELPKALAGMGLSTKESADFMEFWLPKLQAVKSPYVEFNFQGTTAMNEVAPLNIAPAPDSLLRVFMYYQGVSTPGLSMPSYTAPARTGFSVVEWGGSLY
jgi:hypothetical protein